MVVQLLGLCITAPPYNFTPPYKHMQVQQITPPPHPPTQDMALKIISTLLKHATPIDTEQRTAMLFDFIAPLTTDGEDIDDEVRGYGVCVGMECVWV